jgi:hypothetical protein
MRTIARLVFVLLFSAALFGGCDLVAKGGKESAIKDALKKDSRTSQFEFEVAVQEDGSIVITGEVLQPADIDAVTEVATAAAGGATIINRAHVPEPGSDMMQDTTAPMF